MWDKIERRLRVVTSAFKNTWKSISVTIHQNPLESLLKCQQACHPCKRGAKILLMCFFGVSYSRTCDQIGYIGFVHFFIATHLQILYHFLKCQAIFCFRDNFNIKIIKAFKLMGTNQLQIWKKISKYHCSVLRKGFNPLCGKGST